jgi:hypothetical protein
MSAQHRGQPSSNSTAQRLIVPQVERLGVTQQFIALKREIETNGHVNHGGQS